jgi:hypothetical protein
MKVLEKGRPQKGWAKEFRCTGKGNGEGGCGAMLLVEQGDVFRTENHCMGETEMYSTFECSECQVWTDISVPFPVRDLPFRSPHRRDTDAR